LQLWTIQRRGLIELAREQGVAAPTWRDVEARWHEAFRWILALTPAVPDASLAHAPPVWAWHSCGAWQSPPLAEDIDMLLGQAEDRLRSSLVVAELTVPDERVLLSRYGPWNDMLEDLDRTGRLSPRAPAELLDIEPLRGRSWRASGNRDDIQASFRGLRAEWIGDTSALGDWSALTW
jgi:hypothetical protein